MTESSVPLFAPGEYIKDELEARDWTQETLAEVLGRPLRTVNQIITGSKAITAQTAHELAQAFDTSAEIWMNLESVYRLGLEQQASDEIARRAKLHDRAPVNEMVRRGWIVKKASLADMESQVEDFFRDDLCVAARKATPYDTTTPPQKAWVCRAYHLAKNVPVTRKFTVANATKRLPDLHALTTSEQEARHIPEVLGEMGIRLVVIEHLNKTKIDGAALWLDEDAKEAPVIVLSLRYDRIDGFWFTLCHELMHILRGDKWSLDNELVGPGKTGTDESEITEAEKEANKAASEFLIPAETIQSFIARYRPRFSKVNITRFAGLHRIHPGIVVGQLQHHRAITWTHSREMLVSVRGIVTDAALTDGWGHSPGN
jgi:HTH-type transcriptional regulator/antitoxin HigA